MLPQFTPSLPPLNRERRGRPFLSGGWKRPFQERSLSYLGQVVLTRTPAQEFPASQLCTNLKIPGDFP